MLHTLYQANPRAHTQFFVEWMALDPVRDSEGRVLGVTALEMETGEDDPRRKRRYSRPAGGADLREHHRIHQHWRRLGMASRRHPASGHGVWQFHLTGVAGAGVLITEGVRARALLRNKNGERFMERMRRTPRTFSRDVVSRAMATEIKAAARQDGNSSCSLDHLGEETINKRLLEHAKSQRNSPT
jgi:succinate dehydrogenase / fumarate reductase flavoprotein subunit